MVRKKQTVDTQKDEQPILGYIFGGLSFIPLIGVFFAVGAIVVGIVKQKNLPIILGICGIAFTTILYGSLFYFGFVAKTGPYAAMRKQLTVQLLDQTKGKILIYKDKYGTLPKTLNDIPTTQGTAVFESDGWGKKFIYVVHSNGTFELKSSGPDGIANTPDDVYPSQ